MIRFALAQDANGPKWNVRDQRFWDRFQAKLSNTMALQNTNVLVILQIFIGTNSSVSMA